jgi:hypothetical protein
MKKNSTSNGTYFSISDMTDQNMMQEPEGFCIDFTFMDPRGLETNICCSNDNCNLQGLEAIGCKSQTSKILNFKDGYTILQHPKKIEQNKKGKTTKELVMIDLGTFLSMFRDSAALADILDVHVKDVIEDWKLKNSDITNADRRVPTKRRMILSEFKWNVHKKEYTTRIMLYLNTFGYTYAKQSTRDYVFPPTPADIKVDIKVVTNKQQQQGPDNSSADADGFYLNTWYHYFQAADHFIKMCRDKSFQQYVKIIRETDAAHRGGPRNFEKLDSSESTLDEYDQSRPNPLTLADFPVVMKATKKRQKKQRIENKTENEGHDVTGIYLSDPKYN